MKTLIQDSVIEDCEGKEEKFNAEGLEEKLCRDVLQVVYKYHVDLRGPKAIISNSDLN